MTREVPTTVLPETLDTLDAWEVELVLDASAETAQPLAPTPPDATPAPAAPAPAPQNLVQVAVWPTVHQAPTHCVRLWAASLIGLGTLLAASALFVGR